MNPHRGYRKSAIPLNAKRVFEGEIFDVYQWEQELYDGSKSIFEKIVRPDTIAVIPVLPDGSILLIEDTQPQRETILTVPAGRIEEGESPEEAARRELLEETGYVVDTLEPFAEQQLTGKLDWIIYSFVGRNARKIQEPSLDAGEKITARIVSFDEFAELASTERVLRTDTALAALDAKASPEKMDAFKKRILG